MGIFDKAKDAAESLKDKAEGLAGEHGDKVVDGSTRPPDRALPQVMTCGMCAVARLGGPW